MLDKDPALMARCLECDSRIYFERRPDVGEIIVCPECETSLEVSRVNPIRFDWPDDGGRASGAPAAGGQVDLDEFFSNLREEEEEEYGGVEDEEGDYS